MAEQEHAIVDTFMSNTSEAGRGAVQVARQCRVVEADRRGDCTARRPGEVDMKNAFWWRSDLDARVDVEELYERTSRFGRVFVRLERWLSFTPRVELVEHDDGHVLLFDLPGIRPEDVSVRVEGLQTLVVSGERRRRRASAERGRLYSERRYGPFVRRIALPRDADAARLEASFHDGVLEIELPKLVATRRTDVPVRAHDPARSEVARPAPSAAIAAS